MKKYCDFFITTRRHLKAERNNSTPVYEYSWHIWNEKWEEMQSSLGNENEEDQLYDSREVAENEGAMAIQDYYV